MDDFSDMLSELRHFVALNLEYSGHETVVCKCGRDIIQLPTKICSGKTLFEIHIYYQGDVSTSVAALRESLHNDLTECTCCEKCRNECLLHYLRQIKNPPTTMDEWRYLE